MGGRRGPWRLVAIVICAVGAVAALLTWVGETSPPAYSRRPSRYDIPDAASYFRLVNLKYPGLERVKTAVRAGDFDRAVDAYLEWREEEGTRPRYFFDAGEYNLRKRLAANFSGELSNSVLLARHFLRNEFPYQGYVYRLSDPPNFFPARPPRLVSRVSRLFGVDLAASRALEDSLVNSFGQWSRHLGIAYMATQDERFAEKFCYYLRAWSEGAAPLPDPYISGDVTHPQAHAMFTVAARTVSWLDAYNLMRGSTCFDRSMRFDLLRMLVGQLRYVDASLADTMDGRGNEVNREFWRQRANPPLITASRQGIGILMFPELKESASMLDRAFNAVEYYLSSHLTTEGYHPERDSAYHMGSLTYTGEMVVLARVNHVAVPKRITRLLEGTFEVLVKIVQPNGSIPAVGDTPLETSPASYFALGAAIYKRDDFACFQGDHTDLDVYLRLYRVSSRNNGGRSDCSRIDLKSVALPSTGFYVMRSGSKSPSGRSGLDPHNEALYLFFDAAPAYGHTHYDALNIILAGYGSRPPYNLLDESGAANNWTINPLTRYYASSQAHNVLLIDGQVTPSGVEDPPPVVHRWYSGSVVDYVSGGYGRPYQGNSVARSILFVKGEYWILRDEIQGQGHHELAQIFNFAPTPPRNGKSEMALRAQLSINDARRSVVPNYGGARLVLVPADPERVLLRVEEGWKSHPKLSKWAESGNQFADVPAPTVTYVKSEDTTSVVALETILFPLHGGEYRDVMVERLRSVDAGYQFPEASGLRVSIGGSNVVHRIPEKKEAKVDYYVRGVDSTIINFGGIIKVRGRNGMVRTSANGRLSALCLLDGHELDAFGYRVLLESRGDACLRHEGNGDYLMESSGAVRLVMLIQPQRKREGSGARYRSGSGPWLPLRAVSRDHGRAVDVQVPTAGRFHLRIG